MSKEYDADFLEAVTAAIDHANDLYTEDRSIVFDLPRDQTAEYYQGVNQALKAWGKATKCMVPGCDETSIVKSHAISKKMSLATIAKEGHVLEPRLNSKTGDLELGLIGIGDASTFPGFCPAHERLFIGFENKKEMTSNEHYALQVYRSACRELFRAQWVFKRNSEMLNTLIARRDKALHRMTLEQLANGGHEGIEDLSIQSIADSPVEHAQKMISHVQDVANSLKGSLLPALEKLAFHGDGSGVASAVITLDVTFPVALCGSGQFFVASDPDPVLALLNVIPQPKGTAILICTGAERRSALDAYLRHWSGHAIKILAMIESWMIFGTDQWYLSPTVWNAVPLDRKHALLKMIWNPKRGVAEDCPLSVFDDLRTTILQRAEQERQDVGSPAYRALFDPEHAKLIHSLQPEEAMSRRELLGFRDS